MTHAVPSFSIIIPTHARLRQLGECLRALAQMDYPSDRVEASVVQDGDPAVPAGLIAEIRDHLDVTVVSQHNAGPATARNAGVAHAVGDWVVFVDDDCAPAADYLRHLAERTASNPRAA